MTDSYFSWSELAQLWLKVACTICGSYAGFALNLFQLSHPRPFYVAECQFLFTSVLFYKIFERNERTPGDGYEEPEDVSDPPQDGILGPGQQTKGITQGNEKPKLVPRVDPFLENLKEAIKQEIDVLNNKV